MPDHTYRDDICTALIAADVPWWVHDGAMLFAWPAVIPALALRTPLDGEPSWDASIERIIADGSLPLFEVIGPDDHGLGLGVKATDLIDAFFAFSTLPPARAYLRWMCHDFMPAISRYGHYDPATGHTVPVGMELDALERKEGARDLFNSIMPGLGETQ
jgi:hypothetical protein